jgi:hypothetical protein
MPATARTLKFTDEDLAGGGDGAYAELQVPGDFPARLEDVLDYDKRKDGKSWGWIFRYMVATPSGSEVKFDDYLSFGDNARWKLVKTLGAHGIDLDNLSDVDPNDLIGDELMATIDFPRNKQGEATSTYREIKELFPESSDAPYAETDPEVL